MFRRMCFTTPAARDPARLDLWWTSTFSMANSAALQHILLDSALGSLCSSEAWAGNLKFSKVLPRVREQSCLVIDVFTSYKNDSMNPCVLRGISDICTTRINLAFCLYWYHIAADCAF